MREAAAFADWLKSEDRFTLIAHQSPDGDTLGSSLALYAILRAMGKTVQVVCEHEMPYLYAFLPNAEAVRRIENCDPAYSNVISVDCADEKRMGTALPLFAVAAKRGNIDHHLTNSRFGEYVIHSERAAATAELVYRLWQALGVAQTGPEAQQIALCLYTGICTDTGSFSYSNTTPETFRIAAELLAHGIDIASINRQLYRRIPIRKAKMLGHVLNTLQFLENGCESDIVFASLLLEPGVQFINAACKFLIGIQKAPHADKHLNNLQAG